MGFETTKELIQSIHNHFRQQDGTLLFSYQLIFLPASRIIDPVEVGPQIVNLVRLPTNEVRREGSVITGSIVHIDRYGNLITNIPGDMIKKKNLETGTLIHITINDKLLTATFAKTYGDVPEGAWLALVNAQNFLEIARNLRNAAKTLKASTGMRVRLE